jgi:hypothetical protein
MDTQHEQTEENKQKEGDKKVDNKDRLCEYYVTPRGCIKGDTCDFLHPKSPNGSVTSRVCDFFNQPRGCIKGDTCDYLHVRPRLPPNAVGIGRGARPASIFAPPMMRGGFAPVGRGGGGFDDKTCKYFFTPKGCIKGDKCDFQHTPPSAIDTHRSDAPPSLYSSLTTSAYPSSANHYPPNSFAPSSARPNSSIHDEYRSSQIQYPSYQDQFAQARQPFIDPYAAQRFPRGALPPRTLKPKPCEFHSTERGCIKGDLCDFIHQKNKVCDYFGSSRGCRKGDLCDFQHPKDKASSDGPVSSVPPKKRFHPYS